jgi:hypothetical protein
LIVSLIKLGYSSTKQRHYGLGSVGGYDVLLPRWVERNGRWHLDLGWISFPGRTSPSSGLSTRHSDPLLDDTSSIDGDDVQLLPLSLDAQPSSPISDISMDYGDTTHPAVGAIRRVGRHVSSLFGFTTSQSPRRSRRRRGVMFFLPAFSTSAGGVALAGDDTPTQLPLTPRSLSQRSLYQADKHTPPSIHEASLYAPSEGSSTGRSAVTTPPLYDDVVGTPFRSPSCSVDASGTRRPHSTANSRLS